MLLNFLVLCVARDLLEGVLLLLEVLAQPAHDLLLAVSLGVRDQRLVDGDLVVLCLRGPGQDHRVLHPLVGDLDVRSALLVDGLDRRARLVVGLGAEPQTLA